jgi:hypothetical protein
VGDPVSIVAQAGDNQSATVDQDVTTPPTVLVTDVSGNPVKDVTVDFAVESGGGSVAGQHPKTDPNGLAAVSRWTLGTTAGTNTLSATSSGLTGSPVIFTATGTPDVADAGQSTANVPDGTILVQTVITIQARDQFGNALTSGGLDVEVTVTGLTQPTPRSPTTVTGPIRPPTCRFFPGADTITITLDGGQISGSPFTSNVDCSVAGPVSMDRRTALPALPHPPHLRLRTRPCPASAGRSLHWLRSYRAKAQQGIVGDAVQDSLISQGHRLRGPSGYRAAYWDQSAQWRIDRGCAPPDR